jgi:energy-coupling factor transporter ATP-binding protein EcfA2
MLTRLIIRNFKVFGEVDIELGQRVVFVGPNNSGKTSALQALALWSAGIRRWVEKRGSGNVPKERAGVTLNRRDLITLPVPSANLLWRNLHVRQGVREDGKSKTRNVLIDVEVEGVNAGQTWRAAVEMDYANEESFYCRSKVGPDGGRMEIPAAAAAVRLAYLPPMSGMAATETRLDEGAIAVRVGEGRTAEVLRNLCWQAFQRPDKRPWQALVSRMKDLFGVELQEPNYIVERGEIVMTFRLGDVQLDLSASGRGQQQTLLLLAHMAANPGSVLLLDEPDAHLEILRQRQIYNVITEMAEQTGSQVIAASHSEVILNEAADRDVVVAFVGRPHRVDDRGSQVLKALKEVGFEQYLQAEQTGWVLYLEGSTDLSILRAFAKHLDHPAADVLERPFVHYVLNAPSRAEQHFRALLEAKPDLVGIAIYDRLNKSAMGQAPLRHLMWKCREIENYLCSKDVLLACAGHLGTQYLGELGKSASVPAMEKSIRKISDAIMTLRNTDPFGPDIKATDDFLDPLFKDFFESLGLPANTMTKTDYHALAPFIERDAIAPEVVEKLDAIAEIAAMALPTQ